MGPGSFFFRLGLVLLISYAGWEITRRDRGGFSPIRQLGMTSLLIYWIHVEICYGFASRPLQKQLELRRRDAGLRAADAGDAGAVDVEDPLRAGAAGAPAGPVPLVTAVANAAGQRPAAIVVGGLGPRLDGGRLVQAAASGPDRFLDDPGPLAVLALGKAAGGDDRRPGPGARPAGHRRRPGHHHRGRQRRRPAARAGPPDRRDHPLPDASSVRAAQAAVALCERLRPPSRLLVLLSGGGSALAARPAAGLTPGRRSAGARRAVARAGASIFELNTVRKHLSAIKGGQLGARHAVPGARAGAVGRGGQRSGHHRLRAVFARPHHLRRGPGGRGCLAPGARPRRRARPAGPRRRAASCPRRPSRATPGWRARGRTRSSPAPSGWPPRRAR